MSKSLCTVSNFHVNQYIYMILNCWQLTHIQKRATCIRQCNFFLHACISFKITIFHTIIYCLLLIKICINESKNVCRYFVLCSWHCNSILCLTRDLLNVLCHKLMLFLHLHLILLLFVKNYQNLTRIYFGIFFVKLWF